MKHIKSNIKKAVSQDAEAIHEYLNRPKTEQEGPVPVLEFTPLQISLLKEQFLDGKEISRIYFYDGGEFRKLLFIDYKIDDKTNIMMLH